MNNGGFALEFPLMLLFIGFMLVATLTVIYVLYRLLKWLDEYYTKRTTKEKAD